MTELNKSIIDLWRKGISHLRSCGATIVSISCPNTKYALSAYYILAPAEASSNLARYDGLRYGWYLLSCFILFFVFGKINKYTYTIIYLKKDIEVIKIWKKAMILTIAEMITMVILVMMMIYSMLIQEMKDSVKK